MKLLKSKVEIIEQGTGLDGIYKQIELAGRTCYKSENKITETSAKEFVERMIKNGHGAMLEHGTVYLAIPTCIYVEKYCDLLNDGSSWTKARLIRNPDDMPYDTWYVTTNYRRLLELNCEDALQYLCEPSEYHEKRISVRFTCSRIQSQSICRHRVFSFAQESTRYCNYSKTKFEESVRYIIPSNIDIPEGDYIYLDGDWVDAKTLKILIQDPEKDVDAFLQLLNHSEMVYFLLLKKRWLPQYARDVLPNALKTEIVVTGFESDWKHFFDLRCSPAAHPDIQILAKDLYKQLYGKEYDTESIHKQDISKESVPSDSGNK